MKYAVVGEAWGAEEERQQKPFVGASGKELTSILHDGGIFRSDCLVTNVVNRRPPGNRFKHFCGTKKETGSELPPIAKGQYLKSEYLPELDRLREELSDPEIKLIFTCGNVPTWAVLRREPAITRMRGYIFHSVLVPGKLVMPIFHPAAILRQWPWRLTTVIDVIKAKKEAALENFSYPERFVSIEPANAQELWSWWEEHIWKLSDPLISVDIETNRNVAPIGRYGIRNQITCISFSPDEHRSLVVPFTRHDGSHYWASAEEELHAWRFVQHMVESYPTMFQWGLYDVYMLYMLMGIRARLWRADTSIRSHARYPELPKNLEYLGSQHTRERAWKLRRAKSAVDKKED